MEPLKYEEFLNNEENNNQIIAQDDYDNNFDYNEFEEMTKNEIISEPKICNSHSLLIDQGIQCDLLEDQSS